MAFEIDQGAAYAAKVIGGSIAGGLILLRIKPVKTVLGILSSITCSIALGAVFGPPTNDYLVAQGLFGWQHQWVGATAAIWAISGLTVTRRFLKWIGGLDIGALMLRLLQSGKRGD